MRIDGFRCDLAAAPGEFWNKARAVSNRDREVIWLAKVSTRVCQISRDRGFIAHSDPELHQAFDLTYDYDGFEYLEDYFRGRGELKLSEISLLSKPFIPKAIKLRFLENHDNEKVSAIISLRTF